jgi:hypothetical protein
MDIQLPCALDADRKLTVRSATGCAIVAPETVKIEAVSKVSAARKLGIVARVAGRLVGQQAERSRAIRAMTAAVRTTARSFGRVLHRLWLEVTGFVFLAMAALGGVALAHEYAKYQAGRVGSARVLIAICFIVTFAWFGVTSFWRVKKKG